LIVGRENRQPALIVAGIHDEVHRLLDPLGRLLGTEIVQDQEIARHHRTENFQFGRADGWVVGAADHPQQVACVVEKTPRPCLLHDLLQHGDSKVSLTHARLALEQQPFRDRRECISNVLP
jgi:hypothetical protein